MPHRTASAKMFYIGKHKGRCKMVDALLTVKGFLMLAADYEYEARLMEIGGGGGLADDGQYIDQCRVIARRCKEKAYDLLGVTTISVDQAPLIPLAAEDYK